MKYIYILAIFAITVTGFVGCAIGTEETVDKNLNINLTNGYGVYYGDFYNTGSNVLEIVFYSNNLSYNVEVGSYVGTGYHLYFTDVFVNIMSNILEVGTYFPDEESGTSQTFIPGRTIEGNIDGALLSIVTADKITTELLDKGLFTVSISENITTINFEMKSKTGISVNAEYVGELATYDLSANAEVNKKATHLKTNKK